MKITLATHIVVEHVGQQMFLLDSQNRQVYSLPAEGVLEYSADTKTVSVAPSLASEALKLVDAGVATLPGMVSRRAVVGSTGALVAGGLVAMSMPSAAMAASPVPNGLGGGGEPEGILAGSWSPAGSVDDDDGAVTSIQIDFFVESNPQIEGVFNGPIGDGFILTVFGKTSEFNGRFEDIEFELGEPGFDFFLELLGNCPTGIPPGDNFVSGSISNGLAGDNEITAEVVFRWNGANGDELCA